MIFNLLAKSHLGFIALLIFISVETSFAQFEFWAVASTKGDNLNGSLYRINPRTGDASVQFEFPVVIPGRFPSSQLVEGPNGTFWGTTNLGGKFNGGILFEWDPATNQYFRHFDFKGSSGTMPAGLLVFHNGKLYGTTSSDGANGRGTIFEYDPISKTFTKKVDLSNASGYSVRSALVYYSGKFIGLASNGGATNNGVIFEWDPLTNTFVKKIDFTAATGAKPLGSVAYFNGKFYGTASAGGANNAGVIFEWDPTSNTYVRKVDLSVTNGSEPWGSLTSYNGKFYGMTRTGGGYNAGTIFEWDPVGNIYTRKISLYNFIGERPTGNLVVWNDIFYGQTDEGGKYGNGSIFQWNPQSNVYAKRVDFNRNQNGSIPNRTLTFKDGKFFGSTNGGGANQLGVIFQWEPLTNTFSKLVDVGQSEGHWPSEPPVEHNNKLYGMTQIGGAYGMGVIYEWDPSTGIYSKKIDFSPERGGSPLGRLYLFNGKFYGTAANEGPSQSGVLFEWNPETNEYIRRVDFNSTLGINPSGYLETLNGKFYGLTSGGGLYSQGVLFEYDPATNVYQKEYDFPDPQGHSGHLLAVNGLLYSLSRSGGDNGTGILFSWNQEYNHFQTVISLPSDFGWTRAPLTSDGYNFYGITDGPSEKGIFKISFGVFERIPYAISNGDYMTKYGDKFYGSFGYNVFEFTPFSGTSVITNVPSNTPTWDGRFLILPSTIYFSTMGIRKYGDEFDIPAKSSSGLPLKFTSSDETIVKIEGNRARIVGIGSANITAEESGDPTKCFALPATQSITTIKAPLIVTATDVSKKYLEANPSLTFDYSGFVNSDDAQSIDTQPVISTVATATSDAGEYEITIEGGLDDHYEFVQHNNGTLTTLKVPLVVTVLDTYKVYGANNPIPVLAYSGFVGGQDASVIDVVPTTSIAASVTSEVGTYEIIVENGLDNNYEFAEYKSGTLTISKAPIIARAKESQRKFGEGNPAFEVEYLGLANGEDSSVIDTPPTTSTTATLLSDAGQYIIAVEGGSDDNYEFVAYNSSTLTISRSELVVTTKDVTRPYGEVNPPLQLDVQGFVNGDDIDDLDNLPFVLTLASESSDVGEYQIEIIGGSDSNYDLKTINGTLSITKVPLTITADAQQKKYLDPNPELTYTIIGFRNGDDASDITPPLVSTEAGLESNVGVYAITLNSSESINYELVLVNSTLTISKARAEIIFSELEQTVDGTPKEPVVTTAPEGLEVALTFDGGYTIPTTSGSYDVIATIVDLNFEGDASTVFVLSEKPEQGMDGYSIYPNPATSIITIENNKWLPSTNSQIQILNVSGHNVFNTTMTDKIDITLDSLDAGVYTLEITTDGQTNYQRFIIAR